MGKPTRNCSDCKHFASSYKRKKSPEEVICTKSHKPRHSKNYGYRRKCDDYDELDELQEKRKLEKQAADELKSLRSNPANNICFVDLVNQIWPLFDLPPEYSDIQSAQDALNILSATISRTKFEYEDRIAELIEHRQKIVKLAEGQISGLHKDVLDLKLVELDLRRRTMEVEDELIRRDEIERQQAKAPEPEM